MRDRKAQEEARRLQVKRRVKRGIVAGYIHELSARHQAQAGRATESREVALAAARRA